MLRDLVPAACKVFLFLCGRRHRHYFSKWLSAMRAASLSTFVLSEPARPLSLVITTSASSSPRALRADALHICAAREAREDRERRARVRAAGDSAAACVLRIFTAETASMARVTLLVRCVAFILLLMSLSAMIVISALERSVELLASFFSHRLRRSRVSRMPRARPCPRGEEVLELLLAFATCLLRREAVEVAVRRGEDDRRLHLKRERLAAFCFSTSVMRRPASICAFVLASRSEENCMNASSSRNCASSSLILPETFFIALVCAEEPTRETEIPTLIAGRWPWLKRFDSRKIWPSVIEITLVGM
jgi:hypothetical protein